MHAAIRFTTGRLQAGEGITVEVLLPATRAETPLDPDAAGLVAGGQLSRSRWCPLSLAACLALWFTRGKDHPGRGTIVVQYDAPDGLRPAEVGTLIDERVDLRDISATIIDLAVRGYLTIREVKTEGWFTSRRGLRVHQAEGRRRIESVREDDLRPPVPKQRPGLSLRPQGEVLHGHSHQRGASSTTV